MSTRESSLVSVPIHSTVVLGAYNACFGGADAADENGMRFLDEGLGEGLVLLYESGYDVLECRRVLHCFAAVAELGFIARMYASNNITL
jgi:hypothetical protein